jgi:hypothetical protein
MGSTIESRAHSPQRRGPEVTRGGPSSAGPPLQKAEQDKVRLASSDAAAVVGFLRKTSGKPAVIWDGSPIHRGREISRIRYSKLGREAPAGITHIL